ncbi:hypothetical protein L484_024930 [Morus notabilis]|uniref:Aspartic peptidase DDI1-type domain-containing protein n=1 Tax=Morus notabilis TaxID=981085 RepID=W9RRT6_9ROSA|nr:hypothetical protein L484_024930 [Morus notabilis]
MADERAKGLCYNCDEPYSFGHQCKKLFWLEVEGHKDDVLEQDKNKEPKISLHVITGQQNARTMQLRAIMEGHLVLGLVDSGSTHNFISVAAAQRLGVKVQPQYGFNISVANREKVFSEGICQTVPFKVDNNTFITDFLVIPLDGFDIVLGIKWLQTWGRSFGILCLTMSFVSGGTAITLQGHQNSNIVRVHLLQETTEPRRKLDQLLDEFSDLFQEPSGLPPLRNCDHRICLQPNSAPVVIRPYRYPHLQKDEIEKQCEQMLQ